MEAPTHFGRYQVVRLLGRGAMGHVYEGVDPKLSRRVAIKVVSSGHVEDAADGVACSARFVQEAQAVARMNHPNIVTVYDFGEQDGAAYLVMELVCGEQLGDYFDESQSFQLEFTLADSVRMTCELLDAVGYAHEQGVIHRDIKPANVMLGAGFKVKLADFGVARLEDVRRGDADAYPMAGTPSFMSPEQIGGQSAGPRSDLFAVGIILYQFLTTERPFRGQGPFAVQQRILYDEPMPPSLINPLLAPVFDRIIARALAKRPEQRYASAQAFKDDLLRALRGEDVAPGLEAAAPIRVRTPALPVRAATPSYEDPDATLLDLPASCQTNKGTRP